jgi:glycosyl transferase family 1
VTAANGVNWILFDGRTLASSRLQGYAIHDFLVGRDLPSRLLSTPPFPFHDVPWRQRALHHVADAVAGQVVVLQKVRGPRTDELLGALDRRNVHVVYVAADLEPDNDLPLRCDAVVCSSPLLAEYWRRAGAEARHVPEPADFWSDRSDLDRAPRRRDGDGIRLCWIGHRKNWETLGPLRRLLAEPAFRQFDLVTVSNHAEADVQWSLSAARTELLAADVGVVPTRRDEAARYASPNRVVQVMAAGKAVVADRIPPYESVVVDGENGFLCATDDEWRTALLALVDPARRAQLGVHGWESVRPRFHLDAVGEQWLEVLPPLVPGRFSAPPARLRAEAHAGYAAEALERDLGLRAVGHEAIASLVAPAAAAEALRATGRAVLRGVRRRIAKRHGTIR